VCTGKHKMTERVATSNQNQINQVKNQNVFNSEFSKFSNLLNTLKIAENAKAGRRSYAVLL